MSEHTPGPWVIHSGAKGYGHVRDSQYRSICAFGNASLSQDESEANAHLLAAAPKMLLALKQIHYYETIRDPNRGELFLGALRAVEDAIKQATGDSQ
jgi:hypothetical protein